MKKIMLAFATIALALSGCVKDVSTTTLMVTRSVGPEPTPAEIAVEDVQENNEYSFERTQLVADSVFEAWKQDPNLQGMLNGAASLDSLDLEPTDWYVRFLVTDEAEYEALREHPDSLELFDFPLHLNLTSEQRDFFANDTSDGGMWFYTTLPYDFDFESLMSEMKYEKLDEVYIHRIKEGNLMEPDEEFWDALTDAMLGITGDVKTRASSKWFPRAIIKLLNDHPLYYSEKPDGINKVKQYHPLEKVKVRVWQGVNWAKVYTDKNGDTGKIRRNSGLQFKKAVNYEIIWETDRWNIRHGTVDFKNLPKQAKTDGPNIRDTWYRTFDNDPNTNVSKYPNMKLPSLHGCFAAVHKALFSYVYGKKDSLTRDIPLTKMSKINTRVYDHTAANDGLERDVEARYLYYNKPYKSKDKIEVFTKGYKWDNKGHYYRHYQIEQNTYHELGHASHHWLQDNCFSHDKMTTEAYANFVSCLFMQSAYPNHWQRYESQKLGAEQYSGFGEWLWCHGYTVSEVLRDVLLQPSDVQAWMRAEDIRNNRISRQRLLKIFGHYEDNWRIPIGQENLMSGISLKIPKTLPTQLYEIETYRKQFTPFPSTADGRDSNHPICVFAPETVVIGKNLYYTPGGLKYGDHEFGNLEYPAPSTKFERGYWSYEPYGSRLTVYHNSPTSGGQTNNNDYYYLHTRIDKVGRYKLTYNQDDNLNYFHHYEEDRADFFKPTLDYHIHAVDGKPELIMLSDNFWTSGCTVDYNKFGGRARFDIMNHNNRWDENVIDYQWKINGVVAEGTNVTVSVGKKNNSKSALIFDERFAKPGKYTVQCQATNYLGQVGEWSDPFILNVPHPAYSPPVISADRTFVYYLDRTPEPSIVRCRFVVENYVPGAVYSWYYSWDGELYTADIKDYRIVDDRLFGLSSKTKNADVYIYAPFMEDVDKDSSEKMYVICRMEDENGNPLSDHSNLVTLDIRGRVYIPGDPTFVI